MSSITIPTPFAEFGLLYLSSGYLGDQQRPVYAIHPGASGDISLRGSETANRFIAWSQPQAAPYNPSQIIYGDVLYTLLDRGFFTAHDARTGEEIYSRRRIAVGAAFTASPWAYDDKVFALSEDGDAYVIRAGRTSRSSAEIRSTSSRWPRRPSPRAACSSGRGRSSTGLPRLRLPERRQPSRPASSAQVANRRPVGSANLDAAMLAVTTESTALTKRSPGRPPEPPQLANPLGSGNMRRAGGHPKASNGFITSRSRPTKASIPLDFALRLPRAVMASAPCRVGCWVNQPIAMTARFTQAPFPHRRRHYHRASVNA